MPSRSGIRQSWGRRVSDKVRPILFALVATVSTSAATSAGAYLWQQAQLEAADHNWQTYFRNYFRGCEQR